MHHPDEPAGLYAADDVTLTPEVFLEVVPQPALPGPVMMPYGPPPRFGQPMAAPVGPLVGSKSDLASVLLPMFFGPLGLFYATTRGAVIMIALCLLGSALSPLWILLLWPASIVWSVKAVSHHNLRRSQALNRFPPTVTHHPMPNGLASMGGSTRPVMVNPPVALPPGLRPLEQRRDG